MQKTGIVKPTPGREIMFLKTYWKGQKNYSK
jgi:hypothetical protein